MPVRDGKSPLTDRAVLERSYAFVPPPVAPRDGAEPSGDVAWGERLASAYDAALHKEFALVALRESSSGGVAVGLRWRTESELVTGKGQFTCGRLGCDAVVGLRTFEVPFRYSERGESHTVLAKVRLCGVCASTAFARPGAAGSDAAAGCAAAASVDATGVASAHWSNVRGDSHRGGGSGSRECSDGGVGGGRSGAGCDHLSDDLRSVPSRSRESVHMGGVPRAPRRSRSRSQ